MEKTHYRLGTRKSLLALAQSNWVANELMRLNPGIQVELIGIETKGDVILDKPLSQIEGKEFFTAELDHALLDGRVDLTVHSMKDLSLERPPQIRLAAVPKRELQHDIIVFRDDSTLDRLEKGLPIRIGTSSPRRLTLIPAFLKEALPRFLSNQEPNLQFVEIRGNVNTRLSRIHEAESSEKKLDAVVLAFAGLERLSLNPDAHQELTRLLKNTKLMVLPLKACPSAPAQGALAIEAHAEAPSTLNMIQKLHDPSTLKQVELERAVLEEWGGGCHQKLGASALPNGVLFVRGEKPNGSVVFETRNAQTPDQSDFVKIEASDVFNFQAKPLDPKSEASLSNSNLIFIAHSHAFDYLHDTRSLHAKTKKRIWVSGTKSWFKLAKRGVWVEGSLDGQGFHALSAFLHKKLLRFHEPFLFMSHEESLLSGAPEFGAIPLSTYTHIFREIPRKFSENKNLYWSSGLPFETLWSKLGPDSFKGKNHACGPGKTAAVLEARLKSIGLKPTILSME